MGEIGMGKKKKKGSVLCESDPDLCTRKASACDSSRCPGGKPSWEPSDPAER